ncbi:MAG: hypothetical protein M1838_005946 [Thelocarpon superellum]|nr:MAG: hypothetical protein M1838_005946 [Thelocarpon superellum]
MMRNVRLDQLIAKARAFDVRASSPLDLSQLSASPTALSVSFLCLLLLFYQLFVTWFDRRSLSIPEFLWNILVYLVPLRLVVAANAVSASPALDESLFHNVATSYAAKNEAMRKLFGLPWEGVVSTLDRSRILSRIRALSVAAEDGRPAGLGNWDNSCYQNSVIQVQGLASLPSMSIYLNAMVPNPANKEVSPTKNQKAAITALRDIIRDLNDPAHSGRRFWNPSALRSMSSWQQQDAQEYFSKILDEMDKELIQDVRTRQPPHCLTDLLSKPRDPGRNNTHPCAEMLSASVSPLRSVVAPPPRAGIVSRLSPYHSRLRNPLEGLLAQRVGCMRCGWSEGLSLIPFICLTVPLGKDWYQDLRQSLDDYTSLEYIENVECARCTLLEAKAGLERLVGDDSSPTDTSNVVSADGNASEDLVRRSVRARLEVVDAALEEDDFSEATLTNKCKIPSKRRIPATKSRQAVVARAPKSLVIHVNRSIFDPFSGAQKKNYAEVRFQETLELGPWCLGTSAAGRPMDENAPMEQWELDPSRSMLPERGSTSQGPQYQLCGIITHQGRHENGHYVCYRPSPTEPRGAKSETRSSETPGRQWWRISDDDVLMVSREHALSQGGVFMLFYERVEDEPDPELIRSDPPLRETTLVQNTPAAEDAGTGGRVLHDMECERGSGELLRGDAAVPSHDSAAAVLAADGRSTTATMEGDIDDTLASQHPGHAEGRAPLSWTAGHDGGDQRGQDEKDLSSSMFVLAN